MKLLKGWWGWFWRQSRLNKVIIVGFSAALVLFLVPLVVSWFKPTPIHVGVAFYTYERAFVLEGKTKVYFYENRNLVSDCSLRRIEQTLPKGRAKTPDPQSWVLIKFSLKMLRTSASRTSAWTLDRLSCAPPRHCLRHRIWKPQERWKRRLIMPCPRM
jgi:hypothetical protein